MGFREVTIFAMCKITFFRATGGVAAFGGPRLAQVVAERGGLSEALGLRRPLERRIQGRTWMDLDGWEQAVIQSYSNFIQNFI